MKRLKLSRIIYISLIIILFMFTIISCQIQQQNPKPQEEKKDKIPNQLSTLEEKLKEVQKEMEKLQEEIEKPIELQIAEEQKKKQQDEGKNQDSQQQGEDGENQGQEGQDQGQNQNQGQGEEKESPEEMIERQRKMAEMKKEQSILMMRESLSKKVEQIHAHWNGYETKAIEDGASEEDIKKFEDALNNLTIAVDEDNDMDALMSLNSITLHMARFFDFYKGNPDGEILRLMYYARQIYLDGTAESWDKSQESSQNLKSALDRLEKKIELSKDKEELMKNLTLSVDDYTLVIKNKNKELLKIKKDVLLKNLEKVRDEAK